MAGNAGIILLLNLSLTTSNSYTARSIFCPSQEAANTNLSFNAISQEILPVRIITLETLTAP